MDQNWSFTNLQPFVDAINNLANAVREHAALESGVEHVKNFPHNVDIYKSITNYIIKTLTNAKKNKE